MFGLELWFIYSVISAVAGGVYIFSTKIAVERGYNGVLFNTVGSVISAAVLLAATAVFSDYSMLGWFALILVAVNAVIYMVNSVVRYDALGCIDTAIFYPLYKTLSPAVVIIVGVTFFSEVFTVYEWSGLAISLLVPLLLISKREGERQRNLKRGLWLLLLSALLAAASATALKLGVNAVDSVWMFAAITHVGLVIVGTVMMLRKHSVTELSAHKKDLTNAQYFLLVLLMGATHAGSFVFLMLALTDGTLSLVYTIQSLYILIPIVLSIIFYNEHWNLRKVTAIVLSIAALGLMK